MTPAVSAAALKCSGACALHNIFFTSVVPSTLLSHSQRNHRMISTLPCLRGKKKDYYREDKLPSEYMLLLIQLLNSYFE